MEWHVLFAGGAFGLMLVTSTSGFVFLIMRLITNPLKEDVNEMKESIKTMAQKMKSETDLLNMIRTEIGNHQKECIKK